MEIEWATFVERVEGEGLDMIIKAPGADTVIAKRLPAEIKIWEVVSFRVNYHEFNDPQLSVIRSEIREPAQREIVNWLEWTLTPPWKESSAFQEGHSGRMVKAFEIEFPAATEGWYEIQLTANDATPSTLFLRVTLAT